MIPPLIFSAFPYFGVASIMFDHLILPHRLLKFCSAFKAFLSPLFPTLVGFSCCVSSSVIFFSFSASSLQLASSLIPFGFIKNTFHFSSVCSCFYGVSFYSCISCVCVHVCQLALVVSLQFLSEPQFLPS